MTMLQAGKFRRAAITTLGCKINTYESEIIAQKLQKDNWTVVPSREPADLYVINSCTVTAEAGRQTRQEIRRAISRNPEAFVVVTGCYAEMESANCAAIPGVDLVIGNSEKLLLVERLKTCFFDEKPTANLHEVHNDSKSELLNGFSGRTRAFVQIQQGCDQSCTFCIIHKARGSSQSFSVDQITNQIQLLLKNGYKEIVICGIDLGSWGEDFIQRKPNRPSHLVELLEHIAQFSGDYRIRLSSIDPIFINNDLVDLIATDEHICPHLHISIQSINGLILKRMKRRYDPELLYDRVSMAHEKIKDLVLSADVLVGFPTETERHFEDTLQGIENLRISYPHVFPYSQRNGTPAARIPRQVPKMIRKERSARVREVGKRILKGVLLSKLGSTGRVLVEQAGSSNHSAKHGRLDNYLPVRFVDGNPAVGEFLEAQVVKTSDELLIARRQPQE